MIRSLTIIYSTTTGNTEFVIDTIIEALASLCPNLRVTKQRAESSGAEDLQKGDAVLLACGSWNTNNTEGQLSPFMHEFITVKCAKEDLKGKPIAVIGLGDERYFFQARAGDKLGEYVTTHGGNLILPIFKVVNDPFDQTTKIQAWAKEFAKKLEALPATV